MIYLIANISVSILIEQMKENGGRSGHFEELGVASSYCNIRFSIGRDFVIKVNLYREGYCLLAI